MKIHIIKQHDEKDCGAACLAMIAEYFGAKYSLSTLRELTNTDIMGTSIYRIICGADKINLEGIALEGSKDNLVDALNEGSVKYPFIAHVIENDVVHFVVIYSAKRNKFIVGDPAVGKQTWSYEQFFEKWTGKIITFSKRTEFKKGDFREKYYLEFFKIIKEQKKSIALIFSLSLIISIISISGSFLFKIVIDHYTLHSEMHGYNIIFIALLFLYLLQVVIQILRGYLVAFFSKKVDISLHKEYFGKLYIIPIDKIQSRKTGDYLSRFSDTGRVRQAVANVTITFCMDFLMVIFCGFILYYQNPLLFRVSSLTLILYLGIILLFRKAISSINHKILRKNADIQSYIKESLEGIETIKACNAEMEVGNNIMTKIKMLLEYAFRGNILASYQEALVTLINSVGVLMVLWIGFYYVGNGTISLGTLLTFYALLGYYMMPMKNVVELQPNIQIASIALERLYEIIRIDEEEDKCDAKDDLSNYDIAIENVSFSYNDRDIILENISHKIKENSMVAIIGENGSGKSTLIKLLLRFYNVDKGIIKIGSYDIKDISLKILREKIAYVSQNTFLFSDTIKNNLLLSNQNARDEDIEWACKVSCLDHFIKDLPNGYDTYLYENGANLSGGERQRLAIARALVSRPQILILDEATSNLDTLTIDCIQDTINNLRGKMTCIIITHDLKNLSCYDDIIVMKNGKIEAHGCHTELMSSNEYYRKMVE